MESYSSMVFSNWEKFQALIEPQNRGPVIIDGHSMNLASIVAVSRYLSSIRVMKFRKLT